MQLLQGASDLSLTQTHSHHLAQELWQPGPRILQPSLWPQQQPLQRGQLLWQYPLQMQAPQFGCDAQGCAEYSIWKDLGATNHAMGSIASCLGAHWEMPAPRSQVLGSTNLALVAQRTWRVASALP